MTRRINVDSAEHSTIILVPPPNEPVELEKLISDLPFILSGALEYLLSDFDYEANPSSNTAVAARILATTVDRLEGVLPPGRFRG